MKKVSMRSRRIFIAINLDDGTKRYISDKIAPLKEQINANWTRPQQLHLTLSFLGFLENGIIAKICQDLKNKLGQKEIFDIDFNDLEIAPSVERPKMLWLTGEKSDALLELRELVEEVLANHISKSKEFEMNPHITLARMKKKQNLPIREINEIADKIQIRTSIPVSSIDIMESVNEKGTWEHYPIEQIELR